MQKIEDQMLYYGSKDLGLLCWKLKIMWWWLFLVSYSTMTCGGDWKIQIIFTEESILSTNFCVRIMLFPWTLQLWKLHFISVLKVPCLYAPNSNNFQFKKILLLVGFIYTVSSILFPVLISKTSKNSNFLPFSSS